MWKFQEATNLLIRLILILAFSTQLLDSTQALSDKRLCADENCKEIISFGTGKINYRAGAEGMLSFKINAPIRIKSKSAGNDPSLWGIEVGGREGYAPKEYVLENKIRISEKNLKYIVDVNPAKSVPILKTSEKSLETENNIETTTTKPLSVVQTEDTEKPLIIKNLNENLTTETPAAATPVLSEVVDGTQIPIFNNELDGIVESVQEEFKAEEKFDAEDNDEIGDYDEDEEELEEENSFEHKQIPKEVAKNIDSSDMKSNEIDTGDVAGVNEGILQQQLDKDDKQVVDNFSELIKVSNEEKVEDKDKIEEKNISDTMENPNEEKFEDIAVNGIMVTSNEEHGSNQVNTEHIKEEKPTEQFHIPQLLNFNYTENEETTKSTEEQQVQRVSIENDIKIDENPTITELDNENHLKVDNVNDVKVDYDNLVPTTLPIESLQENSIEVNENELNQIDTTSIDKSNLNVEDINVNTNEDKSNEINTLTSDKINLIVETTTDNTVEYNGNSKDNSVVVNDQEFSTINTNNLTPNEPQVSDTINKDQLLGPAEVISKTENLNYPQEPQLESYYTANPTQQLTTETPLPIDSTNSLHSEQVQSPYYQENLKSEHDKSETISSTENVIQQVEVSKENQPFYGDAILHENLQSNEENINPTSYSPYNDVPANIAQPNSQYTSTYQEIPTTEIPPNDYYAQQYGEETTENSHQNHDLFGEHTTVGYSSIPTLPPEAVSYPPEKKNEEPQKSLPSSVASNDDNKENKGLFATIMGTVNNVLSVNKKHKHHDIDSDIELDKILYSKNGHKNEAIKDGNLQYCKKLDANGDCPQSEHDHDHSLHHHRHSEELHQSSTNSVFNSDLTLDTFLKSLASKILEISELLAFLVIVAAASLFFIFGYYCFCNSSREGALLSKLNQLESSLLASHKENSILKQNLMSTRQKLASIEDNSFGSNDMVLSLKKELEEELMEKARLQEQVTGLQKDLENAADDCMEINKLLAEMLNNQSGDERIISSVEELQKQLNEQQNTILEINASLAEKSRENSELQLMVAEQNARFEAELANVQRDNDELEQEKGNLLTRLDELKNDFDKDITAALEGKNLEIKRLQNEIVDLSNKMENEHTKWQTSMAKIEALEECLKNVKKDPNVNITEVINVANVKAQLIETQKKYKSLKERLEVELDQRKLSDNQLQILSTEVEKLKQDFNQSEKDKLEAQTRLEVLSNYFKDKENQLQKELSLKEAMWLKQQGETTTTVDRVTAMQEEIQSLKSQNDSLRAEIEAQAAAHKAQIGTLENRAHETWLAARQSDRRYEEVRAEATALRRKLTALAGGNINEANKTSAVTAVGLGDELTQAPSPIHMESPGSPMLGRMPPLPFLPPPFMGPAPPFMGPPPPFMGMPPSPPFVPPGEMRPAPLGRIMSPPPRRSGRFSPQHIDYEDYLDYEGNNTWHRHTYSPPPRTYRSLSPTDSRYNYGTERDLMSTYDTETDFSPPPSPRESRRRGVNSSERSDNNRSPYGNNNKKFGNKGAVSSGSEKSLNTSHHDTKSKKGNSSGGGKNLV